jgi:Rab GDP dissociation inhibitor
MAEVVGGGSGGARRAVPRAAADGCAAPAGDADGQEAHAQLGDGEYDVVVLGSGVEQCALACLLQRAGRSVLVADANAYYGGDCASLRLSELARLCGGAAAPAGLGRDAEFSLDVAPKVLLARGRMVATLLETGAHEYLDLQCVGGSLVLHEGKLLKAPASAVEAAKTPLVGMLQKKKLRDFVKRHLEGEVEAEEKEHGEEQDAAAAHEGLEGQANEAEAEGAEGKGGPGEPTARELFEASGLSAETQAFVGHALALMPDDSYLGRPGREVLRALRLYGRSVQAYGQSPFIYPAFGIGTIAEAFSRSGALAGATYMLNTPVDAIVELKDGSVRVVSGARSARARVVVADPAYRAALADHKSGAAAALGPRSTLLRSVIVMDRRPACLTQESSAQIILPSHATGRRNDVYATVLTHEHRVCPKGVFAVVCSSVAESEPASCAELDAVVKLLGPGVVRRFDFASQAFLRPRAAANSGVLFTASADATSHFEGSIADMHRVLEEVGRTLGK